MMCSAFTKRLHLLPDNDEGGRFKHQRTSKILKTIKVPRHLGRRRGVRLDLPSPCYPRKLYSSPKQPQRKGSFTSRSSPARCMTSPPGKRAPRVTASNVGRAGGAKTPTGGKLRLPNVPSLNQFPPERGQSRKVVAASRGGIVTAREHYSKYGGMPSNAVGKENAAAYRRVAGAKYHKRKPTARQPTSRPPSSRHIVSRKPSARRPNAGAAYRRVASRLW